MDILVDVVNQKLQTATNLTKFVAGTQEFIRFVFNLGGDWADLMVFAQFTQNETSYNQYLDEENGAYLPSEITEGVATLMLYGSYENKIATSDTLTLEIQKNDLVEDANSTQITLSLYNQLVTEVQTLSDTVDTLDDMVDTAVGIAVPEEIQARIDDGTIAALTIEDGTIAKSKVNTAFRKTLDTADSLSSVITGRSYIGNVSDTWANIEQDDGIVLPNYDLTNDKVIVTCTTLSSVEIVSETDYTISPATNIGIVLQFQSSVEFESTDIITVYIYKPVPVVSIVICTKEAYENMSSYNSSTIYLATTARGFKMYLGELPLSAGGLAGGEITHILSGSNTGTVAGVAESGD